MSKRQVQVQLEEAKSSSKMQVDEEIANFERQGHFLFWYTRLGNKPSRTEQEYHIKQEELDAIED